MYFEVIPNYFLSEQFDGLRDQSPDKNVYAECLNKKKADENSGTIPVKARNVRVK